VAIFTITQRAGENELFAATAVMGMIGKDVPVEISNAPEGTTVTGTIKDARVVDGGMAIELDLEIPEPPTVPLAEHWLERVVSR
jgi:hypothetical protein